MIISLKNKNGQLKRVKMGFSWTVFFFGGFVALIRGDVRWFFIILLLSLCTYGIAGIVFAFIYNKIHINGLLSKGYKAVDKHSENILKTKGMIV